MTIVKFNLNVLCFGKRDSDVKLDFYLIRIKIL